MSDLIVSSEMLLFVEMKQCIYLGTLFCLLFFLVYLVI